jgi:type IV secretory pathway VirB10-like protein
MAVGALIVLVALISAGMYSRSADARRAPTPAPAAPAAQETAPAPIEPPPPPPDAVDQPATESTPAPAAAAPPPVHVQAAKPAPPAFDLNALEHDIDQLSARAGGVNSSIDRLREEQSRDGFGLRGDISSRQESMKLNLSKAQDAISRGDGARAKRYSDLANADFEALEKFLGR